MFFTYFLLPLLIIILLLFLLLWIPVKYNFKLQYDNCINCILSINWLLFHITYKLSPHPLLQINLGKRKIYSPSPIKKNTKPSNKSRTKKNRNPFKHGIFSWHKYYKIAINLIAELFKHIKPRKFKLYGNIGLTEPHQTAFIFAALSPLQPFLSLGDFNLQPLWNEEYIDLDMQIVGKFIPVIILLILVKFIFSQEIRVLWINSLKNNLRFNTAGIYL